MDKCSKFIIKSIDYLINLNSRQAILYASLTSTNHFTAASHNHIITSINKTVYDDVMKITTKAIVTGKIIIAVLAVLLEQFLEPFFFTKAERFAFELSPVIVCLICSVVISSIVFNLISTPNESLIFMFNYKQMLGQDPDMRFMPAEFTHFVNKYNLQGGHQSFTWKDSIKCCFPSF